MTEKPFILIFYSSRSTGGFKGRKGLEHVCHTCDNKHGIKRNFQKTEVVPSEISSLLFSAQLAARELDVEVAVVDISQLSIIHRIQELVNGKPIPRLEVGNAVLAGTPSKQEIIDFYCSINRI